MPTGAEGFRRKQEQKATQQAASNFGIKADFFGIEDGQIAVVRFLEQGDQLCYADSHKIPTPGMEFGSDLLCLDQQDDGTVCPGCQSEIDSIRRRSTRGYLNLIWRDVSGDPTRYPSVQPAPPAPPITSGLYVSGPVYERNDFGTPKKHGKKKIITGYASGVFLWKCSNDVFTGLLEKDGKYRGLMSRDFEIKRVGSGPRDTKYMIEPADVDGGPQAMTVADQGLAEKKYDLAELTKPLDYGAAYAVVHGGASAQTAGPQETMSRDAVATADNVFMGAPPARSSAFSRG